MIEVFDSILTPPLSTFSILLDWFWSVAKCDKILF